MFHKEIRDGETKRNKIFFCHNEAYNNPEEMNDFIKNLMDPFNNIIANNDNNLDTYYDEYYELYGITKPNLDDVTQKIFDIKDLKDMFFQKKQ